MSIRLQKVRKLLSAEKADELLVWNHEGSGQPATKWLSGFTQHQRNVGAGFTGTSSTLLLTRTKQFLITDGRYTTQAKREVKGWKIFITSGQATASQILGKLVGQKKIQKIIFDGSVTPYSVIEDLKSSVAEDGDTSFRKGGIRQLPIEFVSRKCILQELRLVKEKGEIKLLAEAAARAGRAFTRLIPYLRAGMTEKEIAERLEALCTEEGAEGFAFPTSVASGKNGALPHAKSTDKEIRKGELITIDFGIRYKGYCSDMTRMVAVGKPSPRLLRMYEAVRRAQELGCKNVKAGMTGQELDAVCRGYLKKQGFGKYFTHSTGHGIGMEIHELPVVTPHQAGQAKLPAGSVITCEPGIYIPNVGGVRVEDALVLTKKGSVNLTESVPKKLITL